jgi:guanylate kinase
LYGTSLAAVRRVAEAGKICVLEIDVQGAQSVARTDLNARFVFIKPPTWEELERRLTGRGTDAADAVTRRLATARAELAFLETSTLFECVIVNDDLDRAYAELKAFILGSSSSS